MVDQTIIFIFLLSLLITLLSILILRPFARKFKVVDEPSKRKSHQGKIPLIGGLAIFLGVYVSVLGHFLDNNTYICFMISGFLMLILGFIDDCFPLSAKLKILCQIAII